MSKPDAEAYPAHQTLKADPDFYTVNGVCLRHNGQHVCGAQAMELARAPESALIGLILYGERQNLYISFTPAGLRQFCELASALADRAEQAGADAAASQLAATLAKRADK